jgi:glucose-6-phosphate-specific signal transduction histidine kinase
MASIAVGKGPSGTETSTGTWSPSAIDSTPAGEVRDDGVGGARPEGGGLRGLADRIDAFGGRLQIDSPRAGGTRIIATLPP